MGTIKVTEQLPRPRHRKRTFFIAVGSALLLFLTFYGWRLLTLRDFAAQSKQQIIRQLAEAKAALESLNPEGATQPLESIQGELATLQSEVDKYGVSTLARWWGSIQDKFRELPTLLQDLAGISGTAVHVNEDLAYLKEHALGMMMNGHGTELLERLATLQEKLAKLSTYIASVQRQPQLDVATQKTLQNYASVLDEAISSLGALRTFLNPTGPRHVLVMFQNESELRPGGGFVGSYADVTIEHGGVTDIEVRDIYDPDGQLDAKTIPPLPLQRLTKDWEARDANWFADFPTSAKKFISFMNQSKIYSEKNIRFDGAAAVNTQFLGDLIAIFGPFELPEYGKTITAENFLPEIQKEVEAGSDKRVNQPKKILQKLAPMLLTQLKMRTPEQNQKLLERLTYHFTRRGIAVYVNDPTLEKEMQSRGIGGELTGTIRAKAATINEYLAVVTANMAGGKSDFVTRQTINLASTFSATGTLTSVLTITRAHTGAQAADWWYRAPHKTYTQVYLPLGSKLYTANGNRDWPTPIARDYTGYVSDPDVAAIESTRTFFPDEQLERFIAFNKTVFAGWITTPAGATSTFTMTYRNPKKISKTVTAYEFLFEKQSGANTSFSFVITAPDGYIWKETDNSTLSYTNDDPPGRVKVNGTLVKMH